MKIVITGGEGFIGQHLCQKLIDCGHNITILDNMLSQVHGPNSQPKFKETLLSNVEDKIGWHDLYYKEVDCIVCLAAYTGTFQSSYKAKEYCEVNIGSMAILNDLIINDFIKTKKIILTSSRAVYGSNNTKLNPSSIYGATKLAQENILLTGFPNINKCILRLQNVYGPGQSLFNAYTGVIPIFASAIKNNQNIQLFNNGDNVRDFVYIDDVVNSILLCINKDIDGIFDIGSGAATNIYDIALKLKKIFKSDIKLILTNESLLGDVSYCHVTTSKLKEIGYKPQVSLEEGLRRFVDWFNKEDIPYNDYSKLIEGYKKRGAITDET